MVRKALTNIKVVVEFILNITSDRTISQPKCLPFVQLTIFPQLLGRHSILVELFP